MVLPIDTDIMRMRIQKDVENKFRMEIDNKTNEIERITEGFYELKRQNEIYKTSLDSIRYESEKII